MKAKKRSIPFYLMLSFIVFSMLLNSLSIIILQFSHHHQQSYTGLGFLEFFKDIPIALVSVFLVDYIKKRSYFNSLAISLIISAVCSFSIPFLTEFWFLKIWFILIGVSFSIGKICVFSIIKNISDNEKEFSKNMNFTESSFMLGIFLVNMEFALIISSKYREFWKFGFWLVGIISVYAAYQLFKSKNNAEESEEIKPINATDTVNFLTLFDYRSLTFYLIIFLIAFTEQIFNSWLPAFYKHTLNTNSFFALQSSSFLALFSFAGRLLAGKSVAKIPPIKYFFVCIISGIILISLVHFLGQDSDVKSKILIAAFPLVGIFIAPLYPLINSIFLSSYSESKVSKIVAVIILFTSLGASSGSISTAYIFKKI